MERNEHDAYPRHGRSGPIRRHRSRSTRADLEALAAITDTFRVLREISRHAPGPVAGMIRTIGCLWLLSRP
jgi:hypothetical protein